MTNNMNLPASDTEAAPQGLNRKLSLKDRIKLFSKDDGANNDLVRMTASNTKSPFLAGRKSPGKLPRKSVSLPTKARAPPPPPSSARTSTNKMMDEKNGNGNDDDKETNTNNTNNINAATAMNGRRRSSAVSVASSAMSSPIPGDHKSPKILRKKIDKVHVLLAEIEANEGKDCKNYKKLALKLEQYESELEEKYAGGDDDDDLEEEEGEDSQPLPPPPPPPMNSNDTNDTFLSPVLSPRRTSSLNRGSTHSTISAVGSPSGSDFKSPKVLRKKIDKCQALISQESPNSKNSKKLTLKLEQYEAELEELEREEKQRQQEAISSTLSPYSKSSLLKVNAASFSSPLRRLSASTHNSNNNNNNNPRRSSLTSVSEHTSVSALGSPDFKSPKILRKKIEKCQALISQESSPNSKNSKKLALKLEQYESELKDMEEEEEQQQQQAESSTPATVVEGEEEPPTLSSSTSSPMKQRRPSKRLSDLNSPSAHSTNSTNMKILKKKIEKVQMMLIKEKDPKTFDKLTSKLEQYQSELATLKKQSSTNNNKSDNGKSPRRRSVSFGRSTKSSPSSSSVPPAPPAIISTPNCDHKLLQRKLRKVDKLMGDLVKQKGQAAFKGKDFAKLLKKREDYLSALEEAGIKEGKIQRKGAVSKKSAAIPQEYSPVPKGPKVVDIDENGNRTSHDMTRREVRHQRSKSFIAPPPLSVGKQEPVVLKKKKKTTTAMAPVTENNNENTNNNNNNSNRRKTNGPKRKSEKVCAPRLQELDGKYTPKVFDKDPEDETVIRNELAKNFIFQKVPSASLEQMLKAFEPVHTYQKGDVIIQQGDGGDYFYILGKGSVIFEVNDVNVGGTDKVGSSFGELALLYRGPRKATVRANSQYMLVYRVDQVTFRYILQSRSKFLMLWKQTVHKIIAMNRLLGLGVVAEQLKSQDGDDDDSETERNEEAQPEEDDAKAADGHDDDDASSGEASLDLDVAMLDKPDDGFDDDEDSEDEDQELSMYMSQLSQRRFSIQSSLSTVCVDDFHRSSILGEGQFGEVWLVNPKAEEIEDEQFALKIQSKEDMGRAAADYSVAEAIERECKVLSELVHPFIVDFVHHFEDDENIYLVMGAIKGQELWNRVHREQDDGEWVSGLSEGDSKFYAILIADTLHYMHRQHICYRDMKPENVMIDHTGYPVVVDFGFAKVVPDDTTFTFCGTPQYTAPEIIANQGHGRAVDNWALGIVIYEMLTGENPFYYDGISDLQLLNDISNAEPEPIKDDEVDCTDEAKDIIAKLLEKDPKTRIFGSDITSHKWFDSIDINEARKMKIPAPWAPPLDDDDNFVENKG